MSSFMRLTPREFPPLLNEIADPPAALYLEGQLPDPAEYIYLTVVGSRRYTSYGREVVEKIIGELAGLPIVVVSGLAIGIDTIAHKTALKNKLLTIGVPGSGLERTVLHPPSNRGLADQIISAGGALLSELAPEQPAGLHTFPKRNRIMAGLAQAILIIEAGEQSGTLITARLALDYNRDVFVVPGSIFSAASAGTNQLLRQGAAPITKGSELANALGLTPASDSDLLASLGPLSPNEQQIVDCLQTEPLPRDELIRRIKLPISETNSLLAILELKGAIKETLGEIRLM